MKFEFKTLQTIKLNTEKIIIISIIALMIILRFIVQINPGFQPFQIVSNLYSDLLIFNSKIIIFFFNQDIIFNFTNNQIINGLSVLKIDRFYFSINQILTILVLVLITKSTTRDRILYFALGIFIFSLYNSIRISIHAVFPETISVHNWIFNLILIPRWTIVFLFYYFYWKRYPLIKNMIISKLNLSEKLFKQIFINLIIVNAFYYVTIIFAFNNYFFLNGELLVKFILNMSKHSLEFFGYECSINNRTLLGDNASLFMDDACIGIDLMFLFATFIALLPGSTLNKLWYIPLGLIIIILMNATRITLIFISISNNKGQYVLPIEIHDAFTYPVLLFTLILWIIWIDKFYIISKIKAKNK